MDLFHDEGRTRWIRLKTLVLLRWVAVAGQIAAVAVSVLFFGLQLHLPLVAGAIAALVVVNIALPLRYPADRQMQPDQAMGFILFDVVQLAALLALTGGLSNPFVMLMLAPVAMGAAMLSFRGMVVVSTVAGILMALMWGAHLPLRTGAGAVLELPRLFRFGNWIAVEIGIVFVSLYARRVMSEVHAMGDALAATQAALSREQKLTDLGGVIAAAAHELGTPLATITLTAAELAHILADQPDLAEDARLIREQADRCRDILRAMGRSGRDDLLMRSAPLGAVVEEAAEPHMSRGKSVRIYAISDGPAPEIARAPEVIHGLRNLIQNAVDFSAAQVDVRLSWNSDRIEIRIHDDGPGYPAGLISRLGDPMRVRHIADSRKGYDGMGLGLFIAKTLLERSGAQLRLSNGSDGVGAIADLSWPAERLRNPASRTALGENPLIDA